MSSKQSTTNQDEKDIEEELSVLFRTSLHNTVFDVMSKMKGWSETDSDVNWDINWADVGWMRDNYDKLQMEDHQVGRLPIYII